MQTILARLGAVRCLFFKSEQFQLIDMPVRVGASVDKHGHVRPAFTRIQKVRVEKPKQDDMFGSAEPTKAEKHSARLDAFIRKHGGMGKLAHLMQGMTEEQRNHLHAEMGRLGGKTAEEIATMLSSVKPEASAQDDMFAQPAIQAESIDSSEKHVDESAKNEHEIVEYTTRKGKVLRGVVRNDLTHEEAKAIDEYTFKYEGGYFIREKHLDAMDVTPKAAESVPVVAAPIDLEARQRKIESHKGPIESSDPLAVAKLAHKVEQLEKRQATMKAANKAVKSGNDAKLAEMGFSPEAIAKLKTKDFAGRIGFPDYEITNNGSEIRRAKKRMTELMAQHPEAAIVAEEPKIEPVIAENVQNPVENKAESRYQHMLARRTDGSPEAMADEDSRLGALASEQDIPEVDFANIEPFGVSAGISKAKRIELNAQARAIVTRGGPFTDDDKAILRQYSGNGGCGDSLNEFYTLPEVAASMWAVAQRLGVKGDVLEPSCGPGVFLHTAPSDSKVVGVEWDKVSADIAKALHGDRHEVANASLERFSTQDARQFEGVLGNVPFGLRGGLIKDDKPYLKTADAYFCDTSMDKCKAGGVVGLIVPTGVMDSKTNRKLREALSRKGQFLGAQRMPNTAFEHSHTEVTTDLVWFRKFPDDVAGALSSSAVSQDSLKTLGIWDDEFLSGEYFTGRGASNVLGKMEAGWRAKAGMGADITVEGSMQGVPEAINEFQPEADKAPPSVTDILAAVGDDEKSRASVMGGAMKRPYAEKLKVGEVKTVDGIAYVLQGKPPRWHRIDEILQSDAMTQGQDIAGRIDALMAGAVGIDRDQLEADLHAWVEAHGIPSKNKDILLGARMDKTLHRLIGAVKSDGSLSDVVMGKVAVHAKGTFESAVQSLLKDRDSVGVDVLALAAHVDEGEALDQLYGSDKYAIDAATGEWTTKDIYLSGDLWAKVDATKAALAGEGLAPELRKKLEQQAAMLMEKIAPASLEDAFIQMNSAFLPTTILSAFLDEKAATAGWKKHSPEDVVIDFGEGVYTATGGSFQNKDYLMQYLNRSGLRKDNKSTIDDMNVEFKDWLLSSKYREQAEDLYNRKFKGFEEREFSNEPMDIPGMNTEGLKDYQWGGLRWALNTGKGIIADDVGLGKTARALMLARVLKTTGQAKRPLIVVPKSVLENWVAECEKWFPGSRVLTIGGDEDNPVERNRKLHDMQQNDYDFIIISEPQFAKIDLDPKTKYELDSNDFWNQRGDSMGNAGDKRKNQIMTAWDQARADQQFSEKMRTDVTYFNNLGVDALIVDEFHHCFPAGTLVDGVPIESLKAGDLVKSFNHDTKMIEMKKVLAVAAMPSKPLARVTLSNGQKIVSTFDHRFFTNEFGYVEAQHLNGFCSVILNTSKINSVGNYGRDRSGKGVLQLSETICAKPCSELEVQDGESDGILLQQVVRVEMENGAAGSARLAANAGNAQEAERSTKTVQLVAGTGIAVAEDESNSTVWSNESERPASAGRKRTCGNNPTINACECSYVGDGIHGQDRNIQLSSALHNRHCESNNENCNRGGREQSQQLCAQGVGSQEDGVLGVARVESVEILQPGSNGEFERLCSNGLVYDIEVDGNHNFFAEGVLVHNCKNLCEVKQRFGESIKYMGGGAKSMRALDFNLKAQWLLDAHGNKNVYGLTATPTKNSPIEIYAMLSHVAPEALRQIGIRNSEEFIDRFAKIEEGIFQGTDGIVKTGQIVAGFHNMDELRAIMTRYIHRRTAEEVGLELPKRRDIQHMIDMDDDQEAAYVTLRDMLGDAGGKDATGDAHVFSIMDKMNKAALDLSLVDDSYDGKKSPKYTACADEIMRNVKDGGQIVFSDYNGAHEKMADALVAAGIPRNQIGILNGAKTPSPKQRQKMTDDFNSGKLKVVIGNTTVMGEGLNLQKGTADIHHLDLPWEPASMQQRNGRGLRQGNTNESVRIHTYLAKRSFDGCRLQAILAKKDWQDMIWNGGDEVDNLNKTTGFSREEVAIMMSADPDAARELFEANTKGKEQQLIAGRTMDAASSFSKFQELKRSYAMQTNKTTQSALRLKVKLDKAHSSLRANKYFTAKQALDIDTPVIVSKSGDMLFAGAGVTLGKDDAASKYVITGVDPRKQTVSLRGYASTDGAKRTVALKDIYDEKIAPFAFDAAAEAEEVNRKIAEQPIEIKTLRDVGKLPAAAISANYGKLQSQLWEGFKNYSISVAYGQKVPLINKETGKLVLTESYNITGTLSGTKEFTPDKYDFLLPTDEHKAKVNDAWKDAEREASFGTDYSMTGNRRNQRSITTAAKKYAGNSSTEKDNPWSRTVDDMSGAYEGGSYHYGGGDSKAVGPLREKFNAEQLNYVRHAKTFSEAIDAAASLGEIEDKTKGDSATVKLPERVIALLWAKAKHEGVLDAKMQEYLPTMTRHAYASAKHSGYYLKDKGRTVHSTLLDMAANSGHDDLVHAMVDSGLRHKVDDTQASRIDAIQALAQGYDHKPARIKAMQKLADAAELSGKPRGVMQNMSGDFGVLGTRNYYLTDADKQQTVGDKLTELLAASHAKHNKELPI